MSFQVIAVSMPDFFHGEAEAITMLLDSGMMDRIHLRKPAVTEQDMRQLVEAVPARLRHRLSLHDYHSIAMTYGCGIHLNGRNPLPPEGFDGILSRSCHSVEELAAYPRCNYLFLSPIYPSISKPGYMPQFTTDDLRGRVNGRVVALGGITPEKFHELAAAGFGGAAMLGCVWDAVRHNRIDEMKEQLRECRKGL
ncbi:MAG: thiamine phosphate synthase [Muribaculaceae bacterium]|nr:thiamine phosphate synthase [Muribaculaceae bacterium]